MQCSLKDLGGVRESKFLWFPSKSGQLFVASLQQPPETKRVQVMKSRNMLIGCFREVTVSVHVCVHEGKKNTNRQRLRLK